jgi:hypothetical protein
MSNKTVSAAFPYTMFSGTYNSLWSYDSFEEMEISRIIEEYPEYNHENIWSYIDYDFSEMLNSISKLYASECTNVFAKYGILECVADGYDSPKQYNFTTDRIFCEFSFCHDSVSKIISENIERFTQIVKANHSSRSGFVSFYSSDVDSAIHSILSADDDDAEIYFTDYLQLINELEYDADSDFCNSFEGYIYDSCNGSEILYNTISFDLDRFLFNEVTK